MTGATSTSGSIRLTALAAAALVGSPAEVTEKILQYRDLGLSAFIFSGYPHIDEAERFAELVLPNLPHGPLDAG